MAGLITEITDYVDFLIYDRKLKVAICNLSPKQICYINYIAQYNSHTSQYCSCIKNLESGQEHCIIAQQKVKKKCQEKKPFFGACYAGISEYIFPVFDGDEYLCFISISGFCKNKENSLSRIASTSEKLHCDKARLENLFSKCATTKIPDFKYIKTIINPLVNMLILLNKETPASQIQQILQPKDEIYHKIITYISENYTNKITIYTISAHLHYSVSYVCHIFNTHNDKSVMQYVNFLRINKSKELLSITNDSILDIAFSLGFDDSNYFATVFKKFTGITPKSYRHQFNNAHYPIKF